MHIRFRIALWAIAAISASAAPSKDAAGSLAEDRMSGAGKTARDFVKAKGKPPCPGNRDCSDAAGGGPIGTQAETAIAVDQTGRNVVLGFNDFRGFSSPVLSISGFMFSSDGGRTFVDGGQLPTPGTDTVGGLRLPAVFGDPDVKHLDGCNFVYTSLLLVKYGANGIAQTMGVHRSMDCGRTWSGPVEIKPATNPNGAVDINGDAVDAADKGLMDVDPDTGRTIVCWSNFAAFAVEISCSYSDNIMSPNPTFSPRKVISKALDDGQAAVPRFAGNRSNNVYVAWERFQSFNGRRIAFARSEDNGATWSAPVAIGGTFLDTDEVLGNDRVNTFPSLAVDNSSTKSRGNVYLVHSNNNSRDGADVAFRRSTDGGLTFSQPVFLNSRPGGDRAQWFPFVAVDSETGEVHVFYYDQGIDSSGDLTEATHLHSGDGGVTWSPPAPLTDRPFKAGWGNDTNEPNLGDYIQGVAFKSTMLAAFAKTKPVGFADGQPGPVFTVPDVDVREAKPGAAATPLRAGSITFTETGGDGRIDRGDSVALHVPLVNYDTNPLHATDVSAVEARLSTVTPGVDLLQRTASYPSIPAGATRNPSADFTFHVSTAFQAGTNIEFILDVESANGKTTLQFSVPTGTPTETTLLSQNFDAVAPGTLPAGWTSAHGAGANTVPWTTSNTRPGICGTSNKAFHQNANDGPPGRSPARWERLFSPQIVIPPDALYVTVEFDVCYDTEDDPSMRILAYDGLFLRITDLTAGRTLRSNLAEAFEEEFTTGPIQHYPKHLPRSDDPAYFADMSAWAGDSAGPQRVRMKLPGMAGSRVQLRFEYTQDGSATCADVRPGRVCGVSVDNVVVKALAFPQP